MMISCPSCAARYNIPSSSFGNEAMALSCDSCGHRWIENRVIDVIDVSPRTVPATIEPGFAPEMEVRRLVEASREARESYRIKRKQKLRRVRAWGILAACVLVPITAAAAFPTAVVRVAPITIKAYERVGYNINIYGLDIRRVEQQHALVDGTRVLTIKGEVSNVSSEPQKMPWLFFGLRDGENTQVYNWTLDTGARPLRPGETSSFTTRVASPPETAQNLEIRFAHANEISSNQKP